MNISKKVDALNTPDQLIIESDFYKYLADGNYKDKQFEAKLAYLKERFNFIMGTDSLNSYLVRRLNLIHGHYFTREIKPTLKPSRIYG